MEIKPEPPDNLVALDEGSQKELEILRKRRNEADTKCYGIHKSVTVDSDLRTLQCNHCGRILDAFEYVETWAIEGERKMEGLRRVEALTRIASAELNDLGRKIKNLRSQLKRAGQPQPREERQEYESQRWNPSVARVIK